ncbi:tetratricopeptide repeat protein [Microbacterium sp. CIAB417]|uniref:tetratricopeptide repeat protein n=1 Tax=Microbacterium sp. CIAB417 TaxID=2860287 RepID=UPI001FAD021D|nr:tetratricopeptide repeat protein [Microbacterium sp. CIAB417]
MTSGRDPRAVQGRTPLPPRWHALRDRNNAAAELLHAGDAAAAQDLLRETLSALEDTDDPSGWDLRARVQLNLAAALEMTGSAADAVRLTEAAVATASDVLSRLGDEHGTRTVLVNGMLARAQSLALLDRVDDALTQIDAAEGVLDAYDVGQEPLLRFSSRNTRTGLLIGLGRLHEAEAEAQRALTAALAVDPRLAVHVYVNLGAIAQRTGDEQAAWEYMRIADGLQGESADAVGTQLLAENRARVAMQQGRLDEAEEAFLRATELAKAAGLGTRLAAARTGLAAVYLQSGNPARAARRLRELIADMDPAADVHERREAWGFLGDAESRRGRFAVADEAYRTARDLTRSAHERCRVNLRRAEMHAEWASVTPRPRTRVERLTEGLRLAVPVLLTTEALRGDFAPGPVRERWSLQVAAPARELAFRLAVALGDGETLFALIENASASATLLAESIEAQDAAADPDAHVPDPALRVLAPVEPDPATAEAAELLPAAASGFVADQGSSTAGLRFAPPPRVVAIPGRPPVLEEHIRAAEEEYGVTIRSAHAVVSW